MRSVVLAGLVGLAVFAPAVSPQVLPTGADRKVVVTPARAEDMLWRAPEGARPAAWATGRGFDTCTAPSPAAMAAWRRAYSVVNAYIGGVSRACGQPNLTSRWVRRVRALGYRVIPTYVGLQAPCTGFHHRFTGRNAWTQGIWAADDAVYHAARLGIALGAPIYFDMETYPGYGGCRAAVLNFLDAWSRRLRYRGYVSGVYSNGSSAIRDLAKSSGIARPKAIWFAHWDGSARVSHISHLPDSWWNRHRRIKQYGGSHRERHGGVTITIDSDSVDGRVY